MPLYINPAHFTTAFALQGDGEGAENWVVSHNTKWCVSCMCACDGCNHRDGIRKMERFLVKQSSDHRHMTIVGSSAKAGIFVMAYGLFVIVLRNHISDMFASPFIFYVRIDLR